MHGSRRRNRSRRNRSSRVSGLAFGLATLGLDGCLGDDDALGHATTGRDRGREGQDRGSLEVHDAKRKKDWVGGCFAWGLKVIEGRRSRMQASWDRTSTPSLYLLVPVNRLPVPGHIRTRRRQLVCRQQPASRKPNSLLLEVVVVNEGFAVTWLSASGMQRGKSRTRCGMSRAGTLQMLMWGRSGMCQGSRAEVYLFALSWTCSGCCL